MSVTISSVVPGSAAQKAIVDDTTSLESVSITGGSLDVRAFAGNAGLKKLSLTNVESIGIRAFSGSGLTSVTLTGNGTVENSAFANSENLKEVVVDGNVTVGQQAFDGCPVEPWNLRKTAPASGAGSVNL